MDIAVVQWMVRAVAQSSVTTAIAVFSASVLIVALSTAALVVAVRGAGGRRYLVELALTVCIAYALNLGIGAVAFRPRPFVT
ncbi:MAG: hypothetical protein Q8R16_00910, partial [bacterium]|nr:hypothetical protein [bacterium]